MNHDYWDPEDVLAETQRVPCTFNVDLPGMGFLEGTGEADVRKNARAELPYWMAALLAVYDIITIQQPKAYAARVRAALNASATSVQLRNLAPQWYALAERLAQLLGSDEMRDMLAKSVLLAMLSSAGAAEAVPTSVEMHDFVQGLDDCERDLLVAGQDACRLMRRYLAGSST